MRLDKYLCDAGFGTRSEVKNLIKKGRVKMASAKELGQDFASMQPLKDPGWKVEEGQAIFVDGTPVHFESFSYYMLNKPEGVVTATEDKNQKTVLDLITGMKRRDLFPVGRLDKDTEGLLLITNDGQLAHRLLAPGKHVKKVYLAWVNEVLTEEEMEHFRQGLDIGDPELTKKAEIEYLERSSFAEDECYLYEVKIIEGRYHQIKRMFEALDKECLHLKRMAMGSLKLDESLAPGDFRLLSEQELDEI